MPVNHKYAALVLIGVLALTFGVYFPGLAGKFIFDDYPNLEPLGYFGGVHDWASAKSFIFSGIAGPTGRPIALASFLLNDQYWPSQAYSFKYTNVLLHLLVGLGVCWSTFLYLRVQNLPEGKATWVAVLSTAIWLLHPYFVSTTLYVIQRMTQLAGLFSVYGIAAYLHGRQLVGRGRAAGYGFISAALLLGGGLAVLSKENGVLLPLFILVIESTLPRLSANGRIFHYWKIAFLYIPVGLIVVYLAKQINFSPGVWPSRPFDQPQRLYSEIQIIVEYLYDLFIPKFEGRGLYQDGFAIAKGFLCPPSVLVGFAFLVTLLVAAALRRRKNPVFALAILFFLSGHLLESSVIGLELYFEHRNYLPAIFLFLPVALGLFNLGERFSPQMFFLLAFLVLAGLAFMTWERASLWATGYRLTAYWAKKTPNSPRAQNALATIMIENGREDDAKKLLEDAAERMPNSALITFQLLNIKIADGSAQERDFDLAAERLSKQPFDAQAVKSMDDFVSFVTYEKSRENYPDCALRLLERFAENPKYSTFPLFKRVVPYQRARLLIRLGRPDEGYQYFVEAMKLYDDIDSAMEMVVEMARAKYFLHALRLLSIAESILEQEDEGRLLRARRDYVSEIARIRSQLESDVSKIQRY